MGYFIGSDHTHIDYHKALDSPETQVAGSTASKLTKPCPLMPSGKWYYSKLHISYNPTTQKYEFWQDVSEANNTLYFSINSEVVSTSSSSPTTHLLSDIRSGLWAYCNGTSYIYGEVRMSFDCKGISPASAIYMQGSSGWAVNKDKTQAYCFQPNAKTFITECYDTQAQSWTETTEFCEVDVYAYLIPITTDSEVNE